MKVAAPHSPGILPGTKATPEVPNRTLGATRAPAIPKESRRLRNPRGPFLTRRLLSLAILTLLAVPAAAIAEVIIDVDVPAADANVQDILIIAQPAVVVPAPVLAPAADVEPVEGALGRVLQKALNGEQEAPDADEQVDADEKADPDEKVDPQVRAIQQQYRVQFETALNAQLYLVRTVCNPDYKQQVELQKAGKSALKTALRDFAKGQLQQQNPQQIQIFGNGRGINSPPTAQSAMKAAVQDAAEKILTKEQLAALKTDEVERERFRRQTTVDSLVGLLDKRLLLSSEQREQLVENLLENWQDGWLGNAELLMHGNEYLPTIPNNVVVPVFNKRQKEIWKSMPQHGNIVFGNANWANNAVQLQPFKPQKPDEKPAVEQPAD